MKTVANLSERLDEEVEVANTDDDEFTPFKYSITSYGADYTVDGLVKRIDNGSIFVPDFQRAYVWTSKQASRFIESLLLGLPVPGIILSKEQGASQKLLVIDGQQRLRTLQYFYSGVFGPTKKEFALEQVQPRFMGRTYQSLAEEDQRLLDDSILHATVVKQDQPTEDDSSIYHIFERLNTGGTLLKPQQIRASIYHGDFSDLLRDLNSNTSWRAMFGPQNKDMRDQELILRFFALYFWLDKYSDPMKHFLNQFMASNQKLSLHSEAELTRLFAEAIEVINQCIGSKAFKPQKALNAAVFDSVMVGVAKRLEKGQIKDCSSAQKAYNTLLQNLEFATATERATGNTEIVALRMKLAIAAFAEVL